VLVNVRRERVRSAWRMVDAADVEPISPPKDDAAFDIERAIAALPNGARDIFVLHDVYGYEHREIADMLGVVEGTSKSQLARARTLLRKALNRDEVRP
jgi:RNA polymerase sigma-70 factor (ECF subfamily)